MPDVQDIEIPPTVEISEGISITQDDIPHSELYLWLEQAVQYVNELPEDISMGNGTSLIVDETATQLFSYAKWLFSTTAANETLGPTLAPIGVNIFAILTMLVFLAIAWVTVKIFSLIFRFVMYAINWIVRIVRG